jgi:hypothetical protein
MTLTGEENSSIKQEVICETRKKFEEAGFTVPHIAKELALIAFSDMADFVQIDAEGSTKPLSFAELKKNKSRIIKKIREKRRILNGKADDTILEDTFEFELHDKLEALGMAIEIIGIKKPKEIKLNGNLNLDIAGAKQKLAARIAVIAKRRGEGGSDSKPE